MEGPTSLTADRVAANPLGREDDRRRTGGGLVTATDVGADPATIARLAGSWPGLRKDSV